MKKALFIDRDGTLVVEPPIDYQLDSLEKLEFMPRVFRNLSLIKERLDYELVIVSNQDGLGTESFPTETFLPPHNKMLQAFSNEGVEFDDILIDSSFPHENKPTRKPGIGMFGNYISGDYNLADSYVIGDRVTDVMLAKNLGSKAIFITSDKEKGLEIISENGLSQTCALVATSWDEISSYLIAGERIVEVSRKTSETDIYVRLNLDGTGKSNVSTGLSFFDHMLNQLGRHSGIDVTITTKGDLNVDEHHTIEDTGIAIGEALRKALGDKRGINRYGFYLPMDDSLCSVALDFGGRAWLVWDADFKREYVGDMPTEMFMHFFKSLSDSAAMNLNIKAEGINEHHKIEGIFKAFAKAVKMAVTRDVLSGEIPSSKGII